MKNIKSFDNFMNEGVRDKMTPKSEEDIKTALNKIIATRDKLDYIIENGLEKYLSESELKELFYNRIYYFFQNSSKQEYMFYARDTQNIHGINRFDVEDGEVIGIVNNGVILKSDDIVYYQDLKISELKNVISCFIEPIENHKDRYN